MKKLMKKKINLLGKEVSVFAIVMVAMIGLASAALVPYISNTVTGDVDVSSPFGFEVSTTGYTTPMGDVANFPDAHGGETVKLFTRITNLANADITGDNVTIVLSDSVNDNVECAEITEIVAYDVGGVEQVRLTDVTPALSCVDNGDGTISIVTAPVHLDTTTTVQEMSFDITFAPNMMPSIGYAYTGKVMY